MAISRTLTGSKNTNHFLYDLSKNILSVGEIFDGDVLKQSIESILCTSLKERVNSPGIGSSLSNVLFSVINKNSGEELLNGIIRDIVRQEKRIIIVSNACKLNILTGQRTIQLEIPYIIKNTNVVDKFRKDFVF